MMDRVVLRYYDGRVEKGYLVSFSETGSDVEIKEYKTERSIKAHLDELKAIFFVRSFEGKPGYREKKRYDRKGITAKKVFIRFKDKETLLGYVEGMLPWDKGFFLTKQHDRGKGFFVYPVDEESNNIKVFIVASSVEDVTVI